MAKQAKQKALPPETVSRAERLREIRERLGWTWEEWSDRAGCSRSYAANINSGQILSPTVDMLIRLADVAGASFAYLATGKGPPWRADIKPDHEDPYPDRAPIVAAVRLLPYPYADAVAEELLAEKTDDDRDPGHIYWSSALTRALLKHAKAFDDGGDSDGD